MKYYLGIDIGATKTAALICDEEGHFIGEGQGGPGNHETVGFEGMEKSIQEALQQALAQAGIQINQISGAGFGIAGYDWHSEESQMKATVNKTGLTAPYKMVNDVVLGLLAGTSEGWGVAVVSGTGCNCRGWDREHKREGRVTGYGITMGEGAGGSELVHRAMQVLGYSWVKRLPPTALSDAFIEMVGAKSLEDLIQGYTEQYYEIGADAAPIIFQVARQGDPVANDLVRWAGKELGEMANAVIRQLELQDSEFEIALIGSMFKSGEILINPMRETVFSIAPKAKLIPVEVKPVLGAVLLGMEACNTTITPEIRRILTQKSQVYGGVSL
ncbi:MAG: BadF/BadG/BcrA/BcrD ATPase family protein [Anaerolineales bacterium]